ncbi:chitin synthase, partial [Mytilus galloprovincialis]
MIVRVNHTNVNPPHLTAENTFILALDGDVDFTPKAVRLLVDKMVTDDQLGAACGRIHPIGKGN